MVVVGAFRCQFRCHHLFNSGFVPKSRMLST
jgi:hypothetical protein